MKSKRFFMLSALALIVALAGMSFFSVLADTVVVTFEQPLYTPGTINGQDGWSSTGQFDHEVVNNSIYSAPASFGAQSLRISNAVTSGSFGDQTFSKPLLNEAGETSAASDGMSTGPRQTRFEAKFDIASAVPGAEQPGLFMSVSPDRGDGARMSYLGFEEQADGTHVFFSDYQDAAPFGTSIGDPNGCGGSDDFTFIDIATLDRSVPHTIKFVMDFVDGTRNDIVKIYIDGVLEHTGTSWEDYFRYCEGNPTRTVDSLLFRTAGPAAPDTQDEGFLIDNLTLFSGPAGPADSDGDGIPDNCDVDSNPGAADFDNDGIVDSSSCDTEIGPPTSKDQCKNGGYKKFNSPRTFKNQGDCIQFVNTGK